MNTKKILKLASLNIGIAILNITLFSPGLLNIQMKGSNVLGIAIGGTAAFMSIVVFFYGNYKLISAKDRVIHIEEIKNSEDCILALKQAYGKETFDDDITTMMDQAESLRKKIDKIKDILLQKFNIIDTGYERFKGIISDVEYVFYTNIKSILNKINAFDEEDYERINNDGKKRYSTKFVASKLSIYNEYINFVKSSLEDNEEIILKLDMLLLEISKFNTIEAGEIDNMSEIKEMDELIRKSKYYK